VPDRLAYPELFPAEYRYADFGAALRQLCGDWVAGEVTLRADRRALVAAHDAARVVPCYRALFHAVLAAGA
jgi:hypothetical protein